MTKQPTDNMKYNNMVLGYVQLIHCNYLTSCNCFGFRFVWSLSVSVFKTNVCVSDSIDLCMDKDSFSHAVLALGILSFKSFLYDLLILSVKN